MDIETLALAKGYTNKQIKKLSVNGIKGDKGDPGKDAVIDTTLSNSGEAADAKVVGNEISSLKEDLVQLSEAKADKEFVINIFEQLKVLIEAGKTDESIAVLDEAILDLAILA